MMDKYRVKFPKTFTLKIEVSGQVDHYHHCDELVDSITQLRNEVMSAISDFAARVADHNARIDAAVDGLVLDVQGLKDQITALQNSQGQITPADQALLDNIETRVSSLAERLTALDNLTPPPAPPV